MTKEEQELNAWELDAWLEKAAPLPLEAGAKVRILDWDGHPLVLKWQGLTGRVVRPSRLGGLWVVESEGLVATVPAVRLEVIP
jgi:hypothetical protein